MKIPNSATIAEATIKAASTERLAMSSNVLKRALALFGKIIIPLLTIFFKRQGNLFAFIVIKNIKLQPWLKVENNKIIFDLDYTKNKFNPEKYSESI